MSEIEDAIARARMESLVNGGGVPTPVPVAPPAAFRVFFHPHSGFTVGGEEMFPPGIQANGVERVHTICLDLVSEDGRPEKHICWFDDHVQKKLIMMLAERLSEEDARDLAAALVASPDEPPEPAPE